MNSNDGDNEEKEEALKARIASLQQSTQAKEEALQRLLNKYKKNKNENKNENENSSTNYANSEPSEEEWKAILEFDKRCTTLSSSMQEGHLQELAEQFVKNSVSIVSLINALVYLHGHVAHYESQLEHLTQSKVFEDAQEAEKETGDIRVRLENAREYLEALTRVMDIVLNYTTQGNQILRDPASEPLIQQGLAHPEERVRRMILTRMSEYLDCDTKAASAQVHAQNQSPAVAQNQTRDSSSSNNLTTSSTSEHQEPTKKRPRQEGAVWFAHQDSVLREVTNRLQDAQGSVAQLAAKLHLQLFPLNPRGVTLSLSNALVERLQLSGSGSESGKHSGQGEVDEATVQMRFFDVTARIASSSDEAFLYMKGANSDGSDTEDLVSPIFSLLKGDDVLLQMNIITLVPYFGRTREGLLELERSGVLNVLLRLAGIDPNDPEAEKDSLLGDEALRVLSTLVNPVDKLHNGTTNDQTLHYTMAYLEGISHALQSRDESERLTGITSLGDFVASSAHHSLRVLLENRNLLLAWLTFVQKTGEAYKTALFFSISKALSSGAVVSYVGPQNSVAEQSERDMADWSNSNYSSRISGVSESFEPGDNHSQRQESAMLGEAVIRCLGQVCEGQPDQVLEDGKESMIALSSGIQKLIQEANTSAFENIRCASFGLLRMIAAQDAEWGLRSIFSLPRVEALLMDRNAEMMSKQVKEWRFSVLEAVNMNPHKGILGAQRINTIREFLQQGPFVGSSSQEGSRSQGGHRNNAVPTVMDSTG